MRERIFFLLALLCVGIVISKIFLPLLLGLIFGFLIENWVLKAHRFVAKKINFNIYIIAFFIVFIICALLIVPLTFVIISAISDLLEALKSTELSASIFNGQFLEARNRIAIWISKILGAHGINMSMQEIINQINNSLVTLSSNTASALKSTPDYFLGGFLTLASAIYFSVAGKKLRRRLLKALIPWDYERNILAESTSKVIKSLFVANIAIALIQAFVVTLILLIAHVPRYFSLGFLSFFASFIPIIGTGFILIPAGIYKITEGSLVVGILVGSSVMIVGLIDNFIRPLLMKGGINLSFFWLFLSLIGGIWQFGLIGALLGPLVFSIFSESLKTMLRKHRRASEAEKKHIPPLPFE